jgi:hypothetical protein
MYFLKTAHFRKGIYTIYHKIKCAFLHIGDVPLGYIGAPNSDISTGLKP